MKKLKRRQRISNIKHNSRSLKIGKHKIMKMRVPRVLLRKTKRKIG
jgi:hypothetical protein